jgi:hypothetical protein
VPEVEAEADAADPHERGVLEDLDGWAGDEADEDARHQHRGGGVHEVRHQAVDGVLEGGAVVGADREEPERQDRQDPLGREDVHEA